MIGGRPERDDSGGGRATRLGGGIDGRVKVRPCGRRGCVRGRTCWPRIAAGSPRAADDRAGARHGWGGHRAFVAPVGAGAGAPHLDGLRSLLGPESCDPDPGRESPPARLCACGLRSGRRRGTGASQAGSGQVDRRGLGTAGKRQRVRRQLVFPGDRQPAAPAGLSGLSFAGDRHAKNRARRSGGDRRRHRPGAPADGVRAGEPGLLSARPDCGELGDRALSRVRPHVAGGPDVGRRARLRRRCSGERRLPDRRSQLAVFRGVPGVACAAGTGVALYGAGAGRGRRAPTVRPPAGQEGVCSR